MAKRAKRSVRGYVISKKQSGALEVRPLKAMVRLRKNGARLTVTAAWDREAGVWYIASSDLPGLHLEGTTPQELYDQLPGAIEDLLEGSGKQKVSFKFVLPGRKSVAGRVQIAA
jgi:predicted RNase H-like HicB family nuclease